MALLDYKSKFTIRNPSKERPFTSDQFFNWSNNNMYRTSYHDMSEKVIPELIIIMFSHQLKESIMRSPDTKVTFQERDRRVRSSEEHLQE